MKESRLALNGGGAVWAAGPGREPALGLAALGRQEGGGSGPPAPGGMAV